MHVGNFKYAKFPFFYSALVPILFSPRAVYAGHSKSPASFAQIVKDLPVEKRSQFEAAISEMGKSEKPIF
jgi:hypothetical protein